MHRCCSDHQRGTVLSQADGKNKQTKKSCLRREKTAHICTRVASTGTERWSADCNTLMRWRENEFTRSEQGVLPGTHSISCAQKVSYRGNSWGIIWVLLWICMWNTMRLFWLVHWTTSSPHVHFRKSNAVGASQVSETVTECHHIHISEFQMDIFQSSIFYWHFA